VPIVLVAQSTCSFSKEVVRFLMEMEEKRPFEVSISVPDNNISLISRIKSESIIIQWKAKAKKKLQLYMQFLRLFVFIFDLILILRSLIIYGFTSTK
jgi:hypothetical protein